MRTLLVLTIFSSLASSFDYRFRYGYPGLNAWKVGLDWQRFVSTEKVDSTGQIQESEGAESFAREDFDFFATYGLFERLAVEVSARYRRQEASYLNKSEIQDENNAGLESVLVGAIGIIPHSEKLVGSFEVYTRRRTYTLDEETSETLMVLGEGGNEIGLGGGFGYRPQHYLYTIGHLLLRKPSENLSWEVFSDFLIMFNKFPRNFIYFAGVESIYSLGTDPYTNNTSERPTVNTGGSNLYNGINRSYLGAYLGLEWAFHKNFSIQVQAVKRMSGKSTDLGNEVSVKLEFFSRGVSKSEARKKVVKEYNIKASILRASPRDTFVQIDKGITHEIKQGMEFDIYRRSFLGDHILLARGSVMEVKAETSIIRIHTWYRKENIEAGFTARGNY